MTKMENDKLDELSSDVKEIKDALLGSQYNKTAGIIPRLEQVEKWMETAKETLFTTKTKWDFLKGWGGFIAGASAIGYEIVSTVVNIMHKH